MSHNADSITNAIRVRDVTIILTFNDYEQQFFEFQDMVLSDEPTFLRRIFNTLSREEIDNLRKISAVVNVPDEDILPRFLTECNGKFFFNPEVNDDADTRRLFAFRQEFTANMLSPEPDVQPALEFTVA